MDSAMILPSLLVLVTSALLILTGLKKQPGIGVLGTGVIIIAMVILRGEGLAAIGLQFPGNWAATLGAGLGLGIVIQLLAVAIIEPLSEKITHTTHDHRIVENVKGNWKALVQWLLIVWILVALLEEVVYRGFLMTEITKVIGTNLGALVINVVFSSIVFGLSHGYQERCGILSTGIVGMILGTIFVLNGLNLWLVIFTHGFIDTVGISLIAINGDDYIRRKVWKN